MKSDKTAGSGFPRSSRLTTAEQYHRVFRKNQRTADRNWTILYRENQGFDARLGMAVAKKCAKRAVDRNRLKRLARESFRQHKQSLAGFDIVLLARPASVSASNETLCESLTKHWLQISPENSRISDKISKKVSKDA